MRNYANSTHFTIKHYFCAIFILHTCHFCTPLSSPYSPLRSIALTLFQTLTHISTPTHGACIAKHLHAFRFVDVTPQSRFVTCIQQLGKSRLPDVTAQVNAHNHTLCMVCEWAPACAFMPHLNGTSWFKLGLRNAGAATNRPCDPGGAVDPAPRWKPLSVVCSLAWVVASSRCRQMTKPQTLRPARSHMQFLHKHKWARTHRNTDPP